jgi:L-seryl-tRNA(Ser) seleniumtransferase
MMDKKALLSSIPKVDDLLNHKDINELQDRISRTLIIDSTRDTLNDIRKFILEASEEQLKEYNINVEEIVDIIKNKALKRNERHLKRVINATGIIIHTNLGRSILCKDAADAVIEVATNYSNLEYDLSEGKRGSRYSHIEDLIARITGAESAIAVNNNAAAVFLVLSTLCKGKEAIVSRGELVEIGGSFRVPEVME